MVEKKPESKGRPSAEVDVVTLKNIGPQSGKWLAAVGIRTKKDLEDLQHELHYWPLNEWREIKRLQISKNTLS